MRRRILYALSLYFSHWIFGVLRHRQYAISGQGGVLGNHPARHVWTQPFLGVGVFPNVGPHLPTPSPHIYTHVLYGERPQLIIKISSTYIFMSPFTLRICDCSVCATPSTTFAPSFDRTRCKGCGTITTCGIRPGRTSQRVYSRHG